jgi:hypothetical protein
LHDPEIAAVFLLVEKAEWVKRKKVGHLAKPQQQGYQWYKSPFGFEEPPEKNKKNESKREYRQAYAQYSDVPETGGMEKRGAAGKQEYKYGTDGNEYKKPAGNRPYEARHA